MQDERTNRLSLAPMTEGVPYLHDILIFSTVSTLPPPRQRKQLLRLILRGGPPSVCGARNNKFAIRSHYFDRGTLIIFAFPATGSAKTTRPLHTPHKGGAYFTVVLSVRRGGTAFGISKQLPLKPIFDAFTTQKSPCTRQGLSFLFIHFKAILKIKYNAP